MSRPVYETDADLYNQHEFALKVAGRLHRRALKTPEFYPSDYVFAPTGQSDSTWVLAEVKVRAKKYYTHYMISLHKVAQLILYCEVGLFTPMIVVAWRLEKEIGLCEVKRSMLQPGWGGRQDRGDPQDMEPVCFIDLQHFRVSPF